MKKENKNAHIEKYFNDPVQNAAFICCIDILAELVEKYGDKILDAILCGANTERFCDYLFTVDGMSVLCETEKMIYEDIFKAYVQLAFVDGRFAKRT